jgi:cytochrome c oxidase subunit 2
VASRAGLDRFLPAAGLAAATLLLTGCHVPGFPVEHPADKQGQQAASLWHATEFVALGVGLIVWGLIFYVLIRYRRRRNVPDDAIPSQQSESLKLEAIYTAIPLIIVAALFFFTTRAQRKIDAVSSHPDLKVQAVAFQWGWRFEYPNGTTTVSQGEGLGQVPPDLYLPVGETTEIDLTAVDVVHAFYIPAFLFQRAAVPGSPTSFDLTPTEVGTFDGKCSTFCGIGHYQMLFTVRVVTAAQFQTWLASRGAAST